jgi:hypothetical protein
MIRRPWSLLPRRRRLPDPPRLRPFLRPALDTARPRGQSPDLVIVDDPWLPATMRCEVRPVFGQPGGELEAAGDLAHTLSAALAWQLPRRRPPRLPTRAELEAMPAGELRRVALEQLAPRLWVGRNRDGDHPLDLGDGWVWIVTDPGGVVLDDGWQATHPAAFSVGWAALEALTPALREAVAAQPISPA